MGWVARLIPHRGVAAYTLHLDQSVLLVFLGSEANEAVATRWNRMFVPAFYTANVYVLSFLVLPSFVRAD